MSQDERDTELQSLVGTGKKRQGCCSSHPRLCVSVLSVLLFLGVTVAVLGGVFQSRVDGEVQDIIGEHMKLTVNSTATKEFIHSDAPLFTTYYFFNITNVYDVMYHGAIPAVEQVGPYSYKEDRRCFDLEWLKEDTVLKYSTSIKFTFDKEKSGGNDPDRDIITSINVPLIGLFTTLQKEDSKVLAEILEVFDWLNKREDWDGLFTNRTVSELLWGYKDPILEKLHTWHNLSRFTHFVPDQNPVFAFANISTVETPNKVYTGVDNLTLVSKYIQWNNMTSMPWGNPYASMLNGTGGYSFHPGVTRDETLYIFIDEVFRSAYFNYAEDIVDHGITLYKFILPDEELLNTTQAAAGFPSNNCNGVLNLSPVMPAHVPLYASKPHFLHADPVFRHNITGMHPDPSIHDSYVGVEPITGAVLNAAKRIQLNMKLDRTDLPEMKNLRDSTMLPIYYAEQTGAVTTHLANEFKDSVFTVRYGIMGSVWAVIGIAGLVSVVAVMCIAGVLIQQRRAKHKRTVRRQYTGL